MVNRAYTRKFTHCSVFRVRRASYRSNRDILQGEIAQKSTYKYFYFFFIFLLNSENCFVLSDY